VLGGIGPDLRPVQADVAQAYQPGFAAEEEDLQEEPFELFAEALTELGDVWKSGVARPTRYMQATSRWQSSARRREE
jgi:hypothetical protein